MPTPIPDQSKIANVPYVAPPAMQEFIRKLILDNQEMRTAIVSLQSQINSQSRRVG